MYSGPVAPKASRHCSSGINKALFSRELCGAEEVRKVRLYSRVSGPGLDMDVIPTLMVAAVFQNFTSNINIYYD